MNDFTREWASAWLNGLSKLLRLIQIQSWLERRFQKPVSLLGIESFVAFSLILYFFYLMLPMAFEPRSYDGNILNAAFFREHSAYPLTHDDFSKDWPDFKTRLPGPILTGWLTDKVFDYAKANKDDVQARSVGVGAFLYSLFDVVFALYQTSWLLLLFGLLIYYRRDALLIILGTFSGLMLNLSMPAGQWYYPWDLPSLFFFSWAILTYDHSQNILSLAVVVGLGALFKETTLCCGLLILFSDRWSLKQRFATFAATLVIFGIIKKLLLIGYGVNTPFFSVHNFISKLQLGYNLNETFLQPKCTSVILVNTGTLLIMMLLPWRTTREKLFKFVAVVFILGQFLFGVVTEFRVWYELLPLGWILVSEFVASKKVAFNSVSDQTQHSEQ